jgi:hypothetical protein
VAQLAHRPRHGTTTLFAPDLAAPLSQVLAAQASKGASRARLAPLENTCYRSLRRARVWRSGGAFTVVGYRGTTGRVLADHLMTLVKAMVEDQKMDLLSVNLPPRSRTTRLAAPAHKQPAALDPVDSLLPPVA